MDKFVSAWVAMGKMYASDATIVHLFEKLLQVSATFMIDPRFRKEATTIATLEDAGGEIDVFAKAHG